MNKNKFSDKISQLISFSHKVDELGLVRCSSGNMSVRLDESSFAVTATQSWMGELSEDQVSICLVADGSQLRGARPSVEAGFHAGILRERKDVNVVLHFQSEAATAIACSDMKVNFDAILEIPFYIGAVARIPFFLPGTKELADTVVDKMRNFDMLMMENHGQVTVGRDFKEAVQRAVFFEFVCGIVLKTGKSLNPLSDKHIKGLRGKTIESTKGV